MFRNATIVAGVSALATVLVSASTAAAAPAPQLDVYAGDVPRTALTKLVALGIDRHELDLSAAKAGGRARSTSRRSSAASRRRSWPARASS